ncbi:MAG: efflux transporter outer membrane subunit [Lentisphaeria bacterium]
MYEKSEHMIKTIKNCMAGGCRTLHKKYPSLSLLLIVGVAGMSCTVLHDGRTEPPVELPGNFSDSGSEAVPEQWWEVFGSKELNNLVEQTLANNFSLKSAWSRLDQAAAVAAKAGSDKKISLDSTASFERTVTRNERSGRTYGKEWEVGLAAGYEVDLWGRIKASVEAAEFDADAAREDLRAATVSLSASVVTTGIRLLEREQQLGLLDRQIATNKKYLEVITEQFRQGRAAASDVLQQRQLVEQRRGEKHLVKATVQTLRNQLAVLTGQAPAAGMKLVETDEVALPEMPPFPQTGVPAALVQRRPDVRRSMNNVLAADRRVAAAISDRFPRLKLTANLNTSAEDLRDLFDNWLAGLAANIAAPLMDGGRRQAEVRRSKAVLDQALNNYGQVVLEAIREVEDALVREKKQRDYFRSLQQQLQLASESATQTRENYIKGAMSFTRYLNTLLEYQRLERIVLQVRRDLLLERVSLYRALAGSWQLQKPVLKSNGRMAE